MKQQGVWTEMAMLPESEESNTCSGLYGVQSLALAPDTVAMYPNAPVSHHCVLFSPPSFMSASSPTRTLVLGT